MSQPGKKISVPPMLIRCFARRTIERNQLILRHHHWLISLLFSLLSFAAIDPVSSQTNVAEIVTAPGLQAASQQYVGPLADAISRVDPALDGWTSEVFSENANARLKNLAAAMTAPKTRDELSTDNLLANDPPITIEPSDLTIVYTNASYTVRRSTSFEPVPGDKASDRLTHFLHRRFDHSPDQVELKQFKVEQHEATNQSRVYFHATGQKTTPASKSTPNGS